MTEFEVNGIDVVKIKMGALGAEITDRWSSTSCNVKVEDKNADAFVEWVEANGGTTKLH